MEWIRRRPRIATAAGVVGLVLVLFIIALLSRSPKAKDDGASVVTNSATPTPTQDTLTDLPTTTPKAKPTTAAQVRAQTQKAFNQFGQGLSANSGSLGNFNMQGIQGGSQYSFLPKHRVTMRVTSPEPIAYVGWVVPTAYPKTSAIVKNVGTRWSLTLTAYGEPDYAQIYVQANATGAPITCTITVDGHITKQDHTSGPYGRLYPCQG